MAETSGGLVKVTIAFPPDQLAWLRARAASRGRTSIATIVRALIDEAMNAEYRASREDVDTEQG